MFDSIRSNVLLVCRGNTHRFTLCRALHSLISYYVSWIVIGQCSVTVSLLLLPSLCPAKNNDVTLVTMVHSRASRNMPEREREKRSRCCISEALLKPNMHRRIDSLLHYKVFSLCVCCYLWNDLNNMIFR